MEQALHEDSANLNHKIPIHFPEGIYGFENIKDYILLQEDESKMIWSLQAADAAYPTLIVIDPFLLTNGYAPKLPAADHRKLGEPQEEDLCWLTVAVIRNDPKDSVVNLKSPIVINVKNRVGIQTILDDSDYPVRYPLFRKDGRA